ncbi:MAG: hypothetical protein J6S32_02885 [Clostridia bacterium]|nr:hypothetical protein [Clostridia bacterium]MBO7221697.1 hypothetical protein [Clostridia bacterium]
MKVLREIVRNTEMGIQSITNLMSYIENEDFKTMITNQQDDLRNFYNRALNNLDCKEQEQAKSGFFEKTMLKAGVSMNAMFNNNLSHIAEMLIDGYIMGINSVQKCINELKKDGTDMPSIAGEIVDFYDKCIATLREYL